MRERDAQKSGAETPQGRARTRCRRPRSSFSPPDTTRPCISKDHKFCVAPMMDWTDRHCRFFHRLLTRRALLYTEMVTAEAILHGDRDRLLGLQPRGAPGRAAARRLRSGQARRGGGHRRGLRLRRDQPQRRLPVGPRAGGPLRRLPDGGARRSWRAASPPCRRACACPSPSSAASASTTRTARPTWIGSSPRSPAPAAAPSSCTRARPGCRGCRPRRTARCRRSTTPASIA